MECPGCDGKGCDECDEKGTTDITCCPLQYITSDIWQGIELADMFRKGLPPIAGGTLDQLYNFVSASRIIWREQNYWKKKLGILDG